MKLLAVSFIMALGVSAPALAAPPAPAAPLEALPAPEAHSDAAPAEALVDDALTPQERRALLLRCSGPPPRPAKMSEIPKPASKPAILPAPEAKAG